MAQNSGPIGHGRGYPSLDVEGFTIPESVKQAAEAKLLREERENMELLQEMEKELQKHQLHTHYEQSEAKRKAKQESEALKANFDKVGSMKDKLRGLVHAARESDDLIVALQDRAAELENKKKELEMWRSRMSHNYVRAAGESGADDMVDWEREEDAAHDSLESVAAAREDSLAQPEHARHLQQLTGPILATHIPQIPQPRIDKSCVSDSASDWIDDITGPLADYDYTALDHMGHSGVTGYSPSAKREIARLREDASVAKTLKLTEEEALQHITDTALADYSVHEEQVQAERFTAETLLQRFNKGQKSVQTLNFKLQERGQWVLRLQRDRDEASEDHVKVDREQIRLMMLAWRIVSCGCRPELSPNSAVHPFVKKLILNQEIPAWFKQLPECEDVTAPDQDDAEVDEEEDFLGAELQSLPHWMGAVFPPSKEKTEVDEDCALPPDVEIQVQHAYGYRGRDCVGNLRVIRSGQALFPLGSLAVVQDPQDGSQSIFSEHRGEVSCVAMHPDGQTVATGERSLQPGGEPHIEVWSMAGGRPSSLVSLKGSCGGGVPGLRGAVAALEFSKGGHWLVAVGGEWPEQALVLLDWQSIAVRVVRRQPLGRQRVVAVVCDPYSDAVLLCGINRVERWRPVALSKETFRKQLGWFRMELMARALELDYTFPFEEEEAAELEGAVESATTTAWLKAIREHSREAMRMLEQHRRTAATAECECGLEAHRRLEALLESPASDFLVVESVHVKKNMARLRLELDTSLARATGAEHDSSATYERTFELDRELRAALEEMRSTFDFLFERQELQEAWEGLEDYLEDLVETDRKHGLSGEPGYFQSKLGAAYWRTSSSRPFLHSQQMQTMFCAAFTGADSYLTGGEHGSLYLWKGPEMVWAAPVHSDAVTDISLDCLDTTRGLFHVISGGFDGTVCISSCIETEIVKLRSVTLPAMPSGPLQPVVSVSNLWSKTKCSGLLHCHWTEPPDVSARAPLSRVPAGAAPHSSGEDMYTVMVGTETNCVYEVDFISGIVTCKVQGHQYGAISAICEHPTESHGFVTAGEDAVVRLWNSAENRLVKAQTVQDAVVCADVGSDGNVIAIAFAAGGFSLLHGHTLQPLQQVVKEFDVLVLGKAERDSVTLSRGPETAASKNMNKRRDFCLGRVEFLSRRRDVFGLSAEESTELERLSEEAAELTQRVSFRQQSLFEGHTLVAEACVEISRCRGAIEDLQDIRRRRGFLEYKHQSDLRAEMQTAASWDTAPVASAAWDSFHGCLRVMLDPPMKRRPPTGHKMTVQHWGSVIRVRKKKTCVLRFSPDGKYLAVGGEDFCIDLHLVSSPRQVALQLSGHTGTVVHLDWSRGSDALQSNSANGELRFWRLEKVEHKGWRAQEARAKGMADAEWATWTCTMGWAVRELYGVQEEEARRRSVLCRGEGEVGLLAAGDARGKLALLRFPSLLPRKLHRGTHAHPAPFAALRFLQHDSILVSAAAGDCAVLQWQVARSQVSRPRPPRPAVRAGPAASVVARRSVGKPVLVSGGLEEAGMGNALADDGTIQSLGLANRKQGGDIEELEDLDAFSMLTPPLEGSVVPPPGWTQAATTADIQQELQLEHVFGYGGHKHPGNLFSLRTGELLYATGCVAVVSDTATFAQRHYLKHQSAIGCMDVHPDGLTICTSEEQVAGKVHLWDSISMETIRVVVGGFVGNAVRLAFSCAGDLICAVSKSHNLRVAVFEWQNSRTLSALSYPNNECSGLAFCPFVDPRRAEFVVCGGSTASFCTLTRSKQKEWRMLIEDRHCWVQERRQELLSVAFPDASRAVTGTREGHLVVWVDKAVQRIVEAHAGPVHAIAARGEDQGFSIVTGSADGTVRVWSREVIGKPIVLLPIEHLVASDDIAPLGFFALRWEDSLEVLRSHLSFPHTAMDERLEVLRRVDYVFLLDQGQTMVPRGEEGRVRVGELKGALRVVTSKDLVLHHEPSKASPSKPQGVVSLACFGEAVAFGTERAEIMLQESLAGARSPMLAVSSPDSADVVSVAHLPRKACFCTIARKGLLQIWDAEKRWLVASRDFKQTVTAMDLTPNGSMIAVATRSAVLVVDESSLQLLHTIHYREHRHCVPRCLSFSPDSNYLAVGTGEGTVDIVDVNGRHAAARWISKVFGKEMEGGGLEMDFADGVLACKLIQDLVADLTDRRTVHGLRAYALFVERPPSASAWHSRPRSFESALELMEEGLALAWKGADEALQQLEAAAEAMNAADAAGFLWMTPQLRQERQERLRRRIRTLQDRELLRADGLLRRNRPADRHRLFVFLHFLWSMDMKELHEEDQRHERLWLLQQQWKSTAKELANVGRARAVRAEDRVLLEKRLAGARERKQTVLVTALERDQSKLAGELQGMDDRLAELQRGQARVDAQSAELATRLDKDTERRFILMGTCGDGAHEGAVSSLDWSSHGQVVASACLARGERKYWEARSQRQVWPLDVAGLAWASNRSVLGWGAQGLVAYGRTKRQFFSVTDRTRPEADVDPDIPAVDGPPLLATGGLTSGRVFVGEFPCTQRGAEMVLVLEEAVAEERMTNERVRALLERVAALLESPLHRFEILHTAPTMVRVKVHAPDQTTDPRSALQLVAETMDGIARLQAGRLGQAAPALPPDGDGASEAELLHAIAKVYGPLKSPALTHTGGVTALAFDWSGRRLVSVGKGEGACCVWRVVNGRSPDDIQWEKARLSIAARAREALELVRVGEGARVRSAVERLVAELRGSEKGFDPEIRDPLRRAVRSMSSEKLRSELEKFGCKTVGLLEKDEYLEVLCFLMSDPAQDPTRKAVMAMNTLDIRAELHAMQQSTLGLLEKSEFAEMLFRCRTDPRRMSDADLVAELTHFSVPTATAQDRAALLRLVDAERRERAMGRHLFRPDPAPPPASSAGGGKAAADVGSELLFRDFEEAVDAAEGECSEDKALQALATLLKANQALLGVAVQRASRVAGVRLSLEEGAPSAPVRSALHLDWFLFGAPVAEGGLRFRKGSAEYSMAQRTVKAALMDGQRFAFRQHQGREFVYVRYAADGRFVDELQEKPAGRDGGEAAVKVQEQKRVTWGLCEFEGVCRVSLEAGGVLVADDATELLVWREGVTAVRQSAPTAFLYQAPVAVPALLERPRPSAAQIDALFGTLDRERTGRIPWRILLQRVRELARSTVLEDVGLLVEGEQDAEAVCSQILCPPLRSQHEAVQLQDMRDFLLRSATREGHVLFKVEVVRLEGEMRIGLVDARPEKMPAGCLGDTDWRRAGVPAWFMDQEGKMWDHGTEVGRSEQGIRAGDVISLELSLEKRVVSFRKEGVPSRIGYMCDVHGFVSCGIQLMRKNDSVKLLPF